MALSNLLTCQRVNLSTAEGTKRHKPGAISTRLHLWINSLNPENAVAFVKRQAAALIGWTVAYGLRLGECREVGRRIKRINNRRQGNGNSLCRFKSKFTGKVLAFYFNLLVFVFAAAFIGLALLHAATAALVLVAFEEILLYEFVHAIMQVYRGARGGAQVHQCQQYDDEVFQAGAKIGWGKVLIL